MGRGSVPLAGYLLEFMMTRHARALFKLTAVGDGWNYRKLLSRRTQKYTIVEAPWDTERLVNPYSLHFFMPPAETVHSRAENLGRMVSTRCSVGVEHASTVRALDGMTCTDEVHAADFMVLYSSVIRIRACRRLTRASRQRSLPEAFGLVASLLLVRHDRFFRIGQPVY